MNGATTLCPERTASREKTETRRIDINPGRVATWTLIFTNAFFVSYFFAKLFQWV